jgi:hypothetical protein
MKKFTILMLVALLTSSVLMAQNRQVIKLPADMQIANVEKSGWIGNNSVASLDALAPGYEYAIRVPAGDVPNGSEVTSVKFYSAPFAGLSVSSTQYNIKIYEGGSYDVMAGGAEITACGTEVYSQAYTASTDGLQEVELTTAYTVGASEFWIAIENASPTDNAGIWMGAQDDATNGQYVMMYDDEGTDIWTAVLYCVDEDCTATGYFPLTLSFYYDDGGAYQESSDMAVNGFLNEAETGLITEITLTATDSLTIRPLIANEGPDPATEMINMVITVDGTEVANEDLDPANFPGGSFGVTQFFFPIGLMSAADMDAAQLESFDVCVTITYSGTDNNADNNTDCIPVTRPLVSVNTNAAVQVNMYPNPANNVLFVENAQNANISVYNMVGQVMLAKTANSNRVSMDLSKLSEGAYIVRIANGDEVTTQKLNIVR